MGPGLGTMIGSGTSYSVDTGTETYRGFVIDNVYYSQNDWETMSRVLGMRPELFTEYLYCSSQWDGDFEVLAESRTPMYLAFKKS